MASSVKALLEKIQIECVGYPSAALHNKVGGAFATGGHVRIYFGNNLWFLDGFDAP
jgi:hypothetical protein